MTFCFFSTKNDGQVQATHSISAGLDYPAVANGVVYVGSWDHNVYALYANNGTKLWNYTTKNIVGSSPAVVGSSPVVTNGVVYVGSDDNNVYAIGNRTTTLTATVSKTLMAINNPLTVGAPPILIDFGVPSNLSS